VSVELGLKFAVVREDPALEARLLPPGGAGRVLLVASGGCTALSLLAAHPALEVTAFDLNPRQLAHVEAKAAAARAGTLDRLNVEDAGEGGLNQSGEFEGLFRTLRHMLRSFVTGEAELARFFVAPREERRALAEAWRAHRYWPGCFAACFADGFLHAMFGPAATQHAAPGSYPAYFQAVFERGLLRDDAARNPFLQHVLLGAYLAADAPAYTRDRRGRVPALILGGLDAVPALERFDLYSLSNVFDWSDDALVADWAARLCRAARPGSVVLLRQLNNTRDLRRHFTPAFVFDDALGRALQAEDRSLFYNRVEVARRV
jgi:S-adenosylmethionine-diacylglycerol 3-amino-3-carboxypropyl transferase